MALASATPPEQMPPAGQDPEARPRRAQEVQHLELYGSGFRVRGLGFRPVWVRGFPFLFKGGFEGGNLGFRGFALWAKFVQFWGLGL